MEAILSRLKRTSQLAAGLVLFLAVTDSYSRRCGGGAFLSPSSQSWLSAKLSHALSIRLNRAFSWSVVALSASSPQFSAFLRIPLDDFSIATSCRIFSIMQRRNKGSNQPNISWGTLIIGPIGALWAKRRVLGNA
jgi:hypothetical protein